MNDRGQIDNSERGAVHDAGGAPVNRWTALVEITRLLVNSGHPNLAFAAICVFAVPMAAIAALLVAWFHR